MSDLIRREDVIKAISNGFEPEYWANIIKCIDDIPAIEEKTGKWEKRYLEDEDPFFRTRYYCSCCGSWNTYGMSKYCPRCGARMEKEE